MADPAHNMAPVERLQIKSLRPQNSCKTALVFRELRLREGLEPIQYALTEVITANDLWMDCETVEGRRDSMTFYKTKGL